MMVLTRIYPIVEGETVYLMQDATRLGGVDPSSLNTNPKNILDAYERVVQKYDLKQHQIQRMIEVMEKGRIVDFGGDWLCFCYWCDCLYQARVSGVQNLVTGIVRRKSYEEVLSDVFVANNAVKYSKGHNVELRVKKRESGCDLMIDNLKCDCKIRLGYLDPKNKGLTFSNVDKERWLNHLAEKEIERIVKNRALEAFSKQATDILFVDTTRTPFGFLQVAEHVFNITGQTTALPVLKKYLIVFHSQLNGKALWASTWLSPKKLDQLRAEMLKEK